MRYICDTKEGMRPAESRPSPGAPSQGMLWSRAGAEDSRGLKEAPAQRTLWAAQPLPGHGSLGCSTTLPSSSSPPCMDGASSADPRLWEAGSAAKTPAQCPPRLHYCLPPRWAGSSWCNEMGSMSDGKHLWPQGLPGRVGGSAYMSCFPARPHGILPFLCRK